MSSFLGFLCEVFHFWALKRCGLATNSSCILLQNRDVRSRTNLILSLRLTLSPWDITICRLGRPRIKSFGEMILTSPSATVADNGRLFRISEHDLLNNHSSPAVRVGESLWAERNFNICFTERTILSHVPFLCWAPGGIKFHSMFKFSKMDE